MIPNTEKIKYAGDSIKTEPDDVKIFLIILIASANESALKKYPGK